MIIGVLGSRSIPEGNIETTQEIEEIMIQKYEKLKADYFMMPYIKGIGKIAFNICRKHEIPIICYFYTQGQGWYDALNKITKRSKEMIRRGDYFLVFHDGKSKGTIRDMTIVKKVGKPFDYYKINIPEDYADESFNVSKELDALFGTDYCIR